MCSLFLRHQHVFQVILEAIGQKESSLISIALSSWALWSLSVFSGELLVGNSFQRETCQPESLHPPPVSQLPPALTLLTSEISILTFFGGESFGGRPVLWTGLLVGWNSCHWQCCKRYIAAQIRSQTKVVEPGEIVNGVVKGNIEDPDVVGTCKTVIVSIIGGHGNDLSRPDLVFFLIWSEFNPTSGRLLARGRNHCLPASQRHCSHQMLFVSSFTRLSPAKLASPVSKCQYWYNNEKENGGDGSEDDEDKVGVVAHYQLKHPLVLHHLSLLLFGQDNN